MAGTPEFSRMIDIRAVDARVRHLKADEAERAALCTRFGLVSLGRLEADIDLVKDGTAVDATGTLTADIVQICAVTGDDLPVAIREKLSFRFVPETGETHSPDEEVELEADELDEIPFEGTTFDLGEAVAQSLALAIDPYATGPNADAVRKEAGLLDEEASGPFAALAALKGKND
ncbi:DNA-binding protein [Erythrobacter sp. SG61-1L]|uniref:YceD family protein n=1 Tax=Erythrobacter sp. SG61-1L TaxID=1603897 RepID=UPI0006C90D61|nr:DUF177 domain-containing protein [Erythrobacter sp. SG61-1L]KPL69513.1 DNA-binding protein [Erythrobacter sp. SG61-1L]